MPGCAVPAARGVCRCLSPQLKWRPQTGEGDIARRHAAAPQQRPVLPRTPAVAARPGASRCRPDGDRAHARRDRRGARAGARRRAPGPRRPGRADRISLRRQPTHGKRPDDARDDERSEIPQGAGGRRQDGGRPGAGEGAGEGRRGNRLGRPRRAVEETARPRRHHGAEASDAGAAGPHQRTFGGASWRARSAARSTS